jgi:hypothetical protein
VVGAPHPIALRLADGNALARGKYAVIQCAVLGG